MQVDGHPEYLNTIIESPKNLWYWRICQNFVIVRKS